MEVVQPSTRPVKPSTEVAGASLKSTPSAPNKTMASLESSNAIQPQAFWAGATIGNVLRADAIPQRVFYDFDEKTVQNPIKTLADAGVNAFRVETPPGQCLGPTHFVNGANVTQEDGCIDIAVQTAQQAVELGMKFQLTINQGLNISEEWESYSYKQMIVAIEIETKRQLQPFLDVSIVPDIILFENEGSDGFLMTETTTGHTRGIDYKKVSASILEEELCGRIPTGNMASYPQIAGYYKAEVAACNEAITAAGFSLSAVRYDLHSHGQYTQWKEGIVHGENPGNQVDLTTRAGTICNFSSILPPDILSQNVSELLTIIGSSAYTDTPTDINLSYAEAYGKHTSGPFTGQHKLQPLGVEYGTRYTFEQNAQQMANVKMLWELAKNFSSFLGILWWEPWYCFNDWNGGDAALCHRLYAADGYAAGEAPTDTLKAWRKAAYSPWKSLTND